MKTLQPRLRAFTLLELLIVLTITSVLASLCFLGVKSLTGSVGLSVAGDKMSAFFAFAREEAISKNTMTALVLVTAPSAGSSAYRAFSVWELVLPINGGSPDSTNWQQASKWQTLPPGVVVDSSTTATSFLKSPTVSPALPTINYLGTNLNPASGTDCSVQYFMPSGRLDSPPTDPCTLQLVEGMYNGTSTTYLHVNPSSPTLPADYIFYVFSTATGEPKVVRP